MKNFDKNTVAAGRNILSTYAVATGSGVQMFDSEFQPIEVCGKNDLEKTICPHCTGASICRGMHINAIRDSQKHGKPVIYKCELGLMFWTCPVFHDKKNGDGLYTSGALRGSGYANDRTDLAAGVEKCNGTIPKDEFGRRVSAIPSCASVSVAPTE